MASGETLIWDWPKVSKTMSIKTREAEAIVGNFKEMIVQAKEDLLSNPELQINKLSSFIKKFSNFEVNNEKINNIIKTTSFEELKKKEEIDGFEEASTSNTKFFNLGPKNKWKNILNEKLIKIIEEKFCKEMEELRYI